MSTAKINAIGARINGRGHLEVADSISKNIEVGEYISIPLEGNWKDRTNTKGYSERAQAKRGGTKKSQTMKEKTPTAGKTKTKKPTTQTKTPEKETKRKPGRPKKILDGEER